MSVSRNRTLVSLVVLMTGFFLALAAAEAQAGLWNAVQGAFAPVAEAAAVAAPAAVSVDQKSQMFRRRSYESVKTYTGENITLAYQGADIREVIKYIGEFSGRNIVVPDEVRSRMTINLREVPWDQALDIVLTSRNLGLEESGDDLLVFDLPTIWFQSPPRKVVKRDQSSSWSKKVFMPKNAPIKTVAAELNEMRSERGKMVIIGNDIYVEDEPEAVSMMVQAFMRLDRGEL
jgi:Type II secretory pathway, component HofQ